MKGKEKGEIAVIFYGRTFYYCGWTNLGKVMTYIKLGGQGGLNPPQPLRPVVTPP